MSTGLDILLNSEVRRMPRNAFLARNGIANRIKMRYEEKMVIEMRLTSEEGNV